MWGYLLPTNSSSLDDDDGWRQLRYREELYDIPQITIHRDTHPAPTRTTITGVTLTVYSRHFIVVFVPQLHSYSGKCITEAPKLMTLINRPATALICARLVCSPTECPTTHDHQVGEKKLLNILGHLKLVVNQGKTNKIIPRF